MKTAAIALGIIIFFCEISFGQSEKKTTDHVIEGSKVIVELIKALSGKKDGEKSPGCKGTYADLCVFNESSNSVSIAFFHRASNTQRDIVVLPGLKECCLQIGVGVWTYDLKVTGGTQSMRKGDLLIEGCQNLNMNISF